MKIFDTRFGPFAADEIEDQKMVRTMEAGHFPNEDEVETMLTFLNADSVVADIGANIGTVAIQLAKSVKEVHCFEPIPRNIVLLKKNIELQNLTNVTIHEFALGNEAGRTSFELDNAQNAGSYKAKEGADFEVRTLDSLGMHFDFIKMDVEGMEGRVFEGAQQTLASKPVLFFEMSAMILQYGPSLSTLQKMLRGYSLYMPGFFGSVHGKIASLYLSYALQMPGTLFLGHKGGHFDVLALPSDMTIYSKSSFATFARQFALFGKKFLRR